MKTFILTMNQVKDGKMTGDVDFVLVDLAQLEQGKLKVITKTTLKGEPDKTITFREFFTTDGKYIMQSAADRLWVLDAKTLKLVDEKMMPAAHQPMTPCRRLTASSRPDGPNVTGCDMEGKPVKATKGRGKTIMTARLSAPAPRRSMPKPPRSVLAATRAWAKATRTPCSAAWMPTIRSKKLKIQTGFRPSGHAAEKVFLFPYNYALSFYSHPLPYITFGGVRQDRHPRGRIVPDGRGLVFSLSFVMRVNASIADRDGFWRRPHRGARRRGAAQDILVENRITSFYMNKST
jgi:hypothetical protein